MLIIRYKTRSGKFLYNCKRNEVLGQINAHLNMWSKYKDRVDGIVVDGTIPLSDVIAEWQNGDKYVEGDPVEPVAIPGS